MATQDDLNTPAVAVVGLIGTIIVLAIVLLLTVVFRRAESRQRDQRDVGRPDSQISRQEGTLADYGWVDEKKGIAHIPITAAMELVVDELSRDPHAVVTGVVREDVQPPDEGKEGDDAP